MTQRKGRSKAPKSHTSIIPGSVLQKKADSITESDKNGGGKHTLLEASASAAKLISGLTETVEYQKAGLEIAKLKLKFKDMALESLQHNVDTS